MEEKYRLDLIGVTFNQIESGVYALILQQRGTTRRIPIIIGYPEAQAIECKLQEITTHRPLTHDTMVTALKAFGIELKEIVIKRMPHGVFTADMIFTDGKETKIIDGRSSDAIALAIRVNAPIYTTLDVLREAGFDAESRKMPHSRQAIRGVKTPFVNETSKKSDFAGMTVSQLSDAMMRAAANEDYEEAAKIKAELDSRNTQNSQDEKQKEQN